MTTAPATLEDAVGESETANGLECDAHVAGGQLSEAAGSTDSHKSLPQNGTTALSDSSSSDEGDDGERARIDSGYVLLSQEDIQESNAGTEVYSCSEVCTSVETLQTDECSVVTLKQDPQTQERGITRYADPGAVIAPVAKMEGEEASAIMKAMSGFSLPVTATPDWAKVVPEDVWKAELLAGLRKHSIHH